MRNSKLIVITRRLLTPDKIPGINIAAWFSAMESGSVILDGTTASQWSDISGNNLHLSQPAKANQPTYTPDGLNGKPSLVFDGTDGLARSGVTLPNNASIFLSVSYNNTALRFQNVLFSQFNTTPRFYVQADAGNLLGYSAAYFAAGPYTAGVPEITNLSVQTNLSEMYRNGTFAGSMASSSGVNDGFSLGGRPGDFGTPVRMSLSEVVVFSGNPSTTDRQRLEGYLAWKWGLQANLVNNHPFKFSPPYI